jgi:hypothetical protein
MNKSWKPLTNDEEFKNTDGCIEDGMASSNMSEKQYLLMAGNRADIFSAILHQITQTDL